MENVKARIKLLWPHMLILLLLVMGIIISLASLLHTKNQIETLYNASYVVKNAVHTTDLAFEAIQKSVFQAAISNSEDNNNEAITNAENSAVIIQEQVAIIKQNFSGNMDIISRLENNLTQLAPMSDNVINMVAQNKNLEAVAYMESDIIPVINEAQKELALLIQSADSVRNELCVSIYKTQRNFVILLISLFVVSVLFSAGVGVYIMCIQK